MMIYTGLAMGEKFTKLSAMNLGIMISAVYSLSFIQPYYRDVPCALDNGAFSDWQKGLNYPFDEYRFLQTLSKCMQYKIPLDFIVVPDIVAAGLKSLEFSLKWVERLGRGNLALALQDGMEEWHLTDDVLQHFKVLFVGGSPDWKWATARKWAEFAHSKNKKLHIGRVGTVQKLNYCKTFADSVDSTSISRNDYWHKIEEYKNPIQLQIFKE